MRSEIGSRESFGKNDKIKIEIIITIRIVIMIANNLDGDWNGGRMYYNGQMHRGKLIGK